MENNEKFELTIMSFGIKNGIANDIDMMVDCRSLPNPYYVEDLRGKTGLHEDNIRFFKEHKETEVFLKKTIEYLDYHLEALIKSGKKSYKIGVICTGGHHRSVAVAEAIAKEFEKDDFRVKIYHRDLDLVTKGK